MPGKVHLVVVGALGAGAVALGATAAAEAMFGRSGSSAGAVIKDVGGKAVGSLRIADDGNGRPMVTVTVNGLPAGYHGIHIHAKGVCDPKSTDPATGSPFFSAGPHFDLTSSAHPDHSGDLPDLLVNANGSGRASFATDRFRVRQLLDRDGSSVVIHALPDNQSNIPPRYRHAGGATGPDAETRKAGDTGRRVACGVIGS
ncbi:superoxide dismutase family protein [Actinoallomurus purpureus]|uniref:superoxide dismutase family protein n=1 Tax=Actinoallomurus purpureus TaxID=478114 RepID=UPI002092B117|nr:superoxide dismutase family protein [Actinoallomurus purpureus]MCO6006231.1 superoxide dismutase family protein [Actinoallomurus purpureus]